MDIFTTQLARVVPVPIKPSTLKVKALVKNAATGKLTDDIDHLENHDFYFPDKQQEHDAPAKKEQQSSSKKTSVEPFEDNNKKANKTKPDENDQDKDSQHHLDIFV